MANIYTNAKVDLTTTAETTLYTTPSNSRAIVKSIDANATEQLITEPIVMMENEVLQVTAATANRLHVTLSMLEINRD